MILQCFDMVCWVTGRVSGLKKVGVGDDVTGAFHILLSPVATSTSIILICNKIQNGDTLVSLHLDCHKMAIK